MKKIFLIGIYVACLLCSYSCSQKQQTKEFIPTVKIAEVASGRDHATIQYPGYVRSTQEINLSFRVSGSIRKLYVSEGEYVRQGQLVASLDPTDYQTQLNATEAEYKKIKAQAERVIALYKEQGTTPEAYDQARYGLKQIEAKYKNHREQLAYTRIYAPFSGYVQRQYFDSYETVGAGMPVVSLVDDKNLEIEINLSAADFIAKDQFDRYSCTFDLYPDRSFPLSLVGISRKANANQLYSMRLRFAGNKPAEKIYPGMVTMVTIDKKSDEKPIFSVPNKAVFYKDKKSYVYVYHPQTQTIRQSEVEMVQLQKTGNILVQSARLHVGDKIVSSGVYELKDGIKVKPLPETAETNVGGLL